ncbi:MAG: mechanosensitive ion channel [Hydrogenophaga sp.]|uniref:Mechanosensitive ion channel n=1 Tax=Hydrogenophaga crocea TaxID=2716225 RepID=A0A6G8IM55_9BURK|nr:MULTISPECIES: mechanosensitive ion channel domain-containing protein [Hydrogenophaga]MBL0944753.1 mechanosensitive ion channel [Hydrogenophaga sp.]QIM54193.1 mechanosensitive ion channel [Hydrogenophaga crocea]
MNERFIDIATGWWQGLGSLATSGLRIVLILIAAWVVVGIARRAIRLLRDRVAGQLDNDREAIKRAETLSRVFRYLSVVVVSLIAGMLVLGELGVSVAPILGAAGVVGLAVGFGAQSLVKDYFTGFFLLLENQIRQGDVVKLGEHAGVVEEVTLRYVQLRDYDGNVHYVPNGHITTVVNMTRGFSQAVCDVAVSVHEDVDAVVQVIREVAAGLRADQAFGARILDDLEVAGVERWDNASVVIRCRFRTLPIEQWGVRREFLRRLKAAFGARGIRLPYPNLTVHADSEAANAANLREAAAAAAR